MNVSNRLVLSTSDDVLVSARFLTAVAASMLLHHNPAKLLTRNKKRATNRPHSLGWLRPAELNVTSWAYRLQRPPSGE
jgi:hypothetical protein